MASQDPPAAAGSPFPWQKVGDWVETGVSTATFDGFSYEHVHIRVNEISENSGSETRLYMTVNGSTDTEYRWRDSNTSSSGGATRIRLGDTDNRPVSGTIDITALDGETIQVAPNLSGLPTMGLHGHTTITTGPLTEVSVEWTGFETFDVDATVYGYNE